MKLRWGLLGVTLASVGAAMPRPAYADLNPFSEYYNNISRAAAANDAGKVRSLLGEGYSPNQVDENNRTGLDIAAQNGNLQIIAILFKAGADFNQRDNLGATPLHYAADRDRLDVVKLLLDIGVPVDAENKNGVTALMIAARNGDTEMVRALLAHGANPNKSDYTGRDAINWARESRHASVVQLIQDAAAHKR